MRHLLLVVVLGTVVIACGGDDDTSSTADIQVTLSEFTFTPDEVTVSAGAEVTITVTNTGDQPHNWVLLSAGPMITAEDERDEGDVVVDLLAAVTDRIITNVLAAPQTEQQATFLAPSAGRYQVLCTVARHLGFGMEGTLVVEG